MKQCVSALLLDNTEARSRWLTGQRAETTAFPPEYQPSCWLSGTRSRSPHPGEHGGSGGCSRQLIGNAATTRAHPRRCVRAWLWRTWRRPCRFGTMKPEVGSLLHFIRVHETVRTRSSNALLYNRSHFRRGEVWRSAGSGQAAGTQRTVWKEGVNHWRAALESAHESRVTL